LGKYWKILAKIVRYGQNKGRFRKMSEGISKILLTIIYKRRRYPGYSIFMKCIQVPFPKKITS
jgi:hypothetical protein